MHEIIITQREAGQRLDHLLEKKLKNAQKSFIYKMLRKKNITLNGKKASGTEKLTVQDSIKVFFSEDTWIKFTGDTRSDMPSGGTSSDNSASEYRRLYPYKKLDILYEDEHAVLINKPSGMLSQKAHDSDISLCEYLIGYLLHSGQITPEDLSLVKPSVCNRLDRNTSGIVLCGKSSSGLRELSGIIQDRSIEKYYHCIVLGTINNPQKLDGYLLKDEKTNQVRILKEKKGDAKIIRTEYIPVSSFIVSLSPESKPIDCSLLKVHLITGRSHQIRSHLASIGHPIIGDYKYGNEAINRLFMKYRGIRSQLLHCSQVNFPLLEHALSGLSEKIIEAPLPKSFKDLSGEL